MIGLLCLDKGDYLSPINGPRQSVLAQTSSMTDPDRTFGAACAQVGSADGANLFDRQANDLLLGFTYRRLF